MLLLKLVQRSLLSSTSPSYSCRITAVRANSTLKPNADEAPAKEETKKDEGRKDMTPKSKLRLRQLKERYASNPAPLMEFFDDMENWAQSKVRVGREWRIEELRIKSNSDLHKLWYVLLKERNMLLTMTHEAEEQKEAMPNPERLDKVDQSMLNIEAVVRERNKAYMELEVGPGETYERPSVFRRDLFGRYGYVTCSQHLVPYRMNRYYMKVFGPGTGKEVDHFWNRFREQKARRIKRRTMQDWAMVRQLIRRFPNLDMDYLQELYPRVPVKYFKDHLDRYREVIPVSFVLEKERGQKC